MVCYLSASASSESQPSKRNWRVRPVDVVCCCSLLVPPQGCESHLPDRCEGEDNGQMLKVAWGDRGCRLRGGSAGVEAGGEGGVGRTDADANGTVGRFCVVIGGCTVAGYGENNEGRPGCDLAVVTLGEPWPKFPAVFPMMLPEGGFGGAVTGSDRDEDPPGVAAAFSASLRFLDAASVIRMKALMLGFLSLPMESIPPP